MSATIVVPAVVPAVVPSLFQSSRPCVPSSAEKKRVPPAFVRCSGVELAAAPTG
jgi:hypothetical protein